MIKDGPAYRHVFWKDGIYEITSYDWTTEDGDHRIGLKNIKTGEDVRVNGSTWVARLSEVRDVTSSDYEEFYNE